MSITLIILLFVINSGRIIFEDAASFTMFSKVVVDDYGFASLKNHFKANDITTVNLIGPDRQIVFTGIFYSSQNETVIPLANYRNNPQPKKY